MQTTDDPSNRQMKFSRLLLAVCVFLCVHMVRFHVSAEFVMTESGSKMAPLCVSYILLLFIYERALNQYLVDC
jgi:hypothetical protein